MDRCLRLSMVALVSGLALSQAASALAALTPRDDGFSSSDCGGTVCPGVRPVFAQWEEARRVRYGYGMTKRAEQAVHWYRKAAEEDDPRAMHNLGLMLVRGQGVDRDPHQAWRWLLVSLERGVAESALALGNMARLGDRGAPDMAAAGSFYRKGAERGDSRSMHALGNLHAAGSDPSRSLGEAYFWYYLAAGKGHLLAIAARDAARPMLSSSVRRDIEIRAEALLRRRSETPVGPKK